MSIGSLFGGIAQGAFNYQSVKETNAANKEINQMNNAFNQMMWEKEKEYNSPLAQMQRLQQAGINPAFAYSNGVSNTVSSAPTAASPIPMQPYIGSELAEIGNRMSLDSLRGVEKDESVSRTRLNENGIFVQDATIDKYRKEIQDIEKKWDLLSSEIAKNDATVKNLESLSNLNDAKKVGQEIDNWIKEASKEYEVLRKVCEAKGCLESVKLTIAKIAESKTQSDVNRSIVRRNNAEIKRIAADIEEVHARISKLEAETRTIEFWNGINEETRKFLVDQVQFKTNKMEYEMDITEFQLRVQEVKQSIRDQKVIGDLYVFLEGVIGLVEPVFGSGVSLGISKLK